MLANACQQSPLPLTGQGFRPRCAKCRHVCPAKCGPEFRAHRSSWPQSAQHIPDRPLTCGPGSPRSGSPRIRCRHRGRGCRQTSHEESSPRPALQGAHPACPHQESDVAVLLRVKDSMARALPRPYGMQERREFPHLLSTLPTPCWGPAAVRHSKAQQGTAQHSTAQHSTAEHSTPMEGHASL
jgi:hypothetical protein